MCWMCDEREELARIEAAKAAEVKAEVLKEVPTSRVLTREMVLRGRPCGEYRNRLIERFSETIDVTVELAVSQASDWDWWWAATNLLSPAAYDKCRRLFNVLDESYEQELAPYNELMSKAWNEYYAVRDSAMLEALELGLYGWDRSDYASRKAEPVLELPQAARDAARKVANKRFYEGQAKVWAELFLADGEAYAEQHKDDEPFRDTWVDEIQDYDVYGDYDNEEEDY